MAADFRVRGGAMKLIDRAAERDTRDRFAATIRAGESQALVVSGEAGVGKTALLDYLAANASGCRIARIAGVQSEMELPFSALHQLCAPSLDQLQGLPVPPGPDPAPAADRRGRAGRRSGLDVGGRAARGGADPHGGSGLVGLTDRVDALGGRLWLHSPPAGGTTVRAELPLRQAASPRRWFGCSCDSSARPTLTA